MIESDVLVLGILGDELQDGKPNTLHAFGSEIVPHRDVLRSLGDQPGCDP
jgi:hypothetical protein